MNDVDMLAAQLIGRYLAVLVNDDEMQADHVSDGIISFGSVDILD